MNFNETWNDTKNSDKKPTELKKVIVSIRSSDTIKLAMAKNGGFVAVIKRK